MEKNRRFTKQDIEAIVSVLEEGNLQMGVKVIEFEEEFAQYCGVKYAVAVSSSAAGMHIAMMAAAVGHKDEVVVPPLCPTAGPNAVFYQQGVNIFADVDGTGNVDASEIASKINSNTKAVVLHHYSGFPCDIEPILNIVSNKDIAIIVDASTALGAQYDGKMISHFGDMVVFNFGKGEHIYTGEGGMVVTNSDELVQWLRMFRDEGFVREKEMLTKYEGHWYFEMQDLGYPYRMTELQAALGLSQLGRIDEILSYRAHVAEYYDKAFSDIEHLAVPAHREEHFNTGKNKVHARGFYTLKLVSDKLIENKHKILEYLNLKGIETDVCYYPVFLHPYYLWVGHPDVCTLEGSRAPKAEEFYRQIFTLPLTENHTDNLNELNRIVDTIKQALIKISA